jgi:plasmid stabilization system protein ParE
MKIKILQSFSIKLANQVEYIAKDKPVAARKLKNEILSLLKKIPKNPYLNRKSIYFDNSTIRDLVCKGYVIVYRINILKDRVEVFGFIKYQDRL